MKNTNGAYGGNGQVKESETWTVEKLVDEWKICRRITPRDNHESRLVVDNP